MVNLKNLKEHDKIISNIDCKINEIVITDGVKYLFDGKNKYPLSNFRDQDFFFYDKDVWGVGEYDFKFLN